MRTSFERLDDVPCVCPIACNLKSRHTAAISVTSLANWAKRLVIHVGMHEEEGDYITHI